MEDNIMIGLISFPVILWSVVAATVVVAFVVSAYLRLKFPNCNDFSIE